MYLGQYLREGAEDGCNQQQSSLCGVVLQYPLLARKFLVDPQMAYLRKMTGLCSDHFSYSPFASNS